MKKLIQNLFAIFVFSFPFSLRILMNDNMAYRFGKFNPWVATFIYVPELLLWVTFALWVYENWKPKHSFKIKYEPLWILIGLFMLNALLVTGIQGNLLLGLMFILRIIEMIMFYLLLTHKVLQMRQLVLILLSSAGFQMLTGYLQWSVNHSLGIGLLGESTIRPTIKNVAKIDIGGASKQIRAYGTFLHPNILAAYLLTVFLVAVPYLKFKWRELAFGILVLGLYITQSHAAMLVTVISIGLYLCFTIAHRIRVREAFGIFLVVLLAIWNLWIFNYSNVLQSSRPSFANRLSQNVISHEMFLDKPLGVGARNFTIKMEDYSYKKLKPWEFQPVHNVYFLILNELGFQGLLILLSALVLMLYKYWHKGLAIPLFALLFIAPFDHFLFDSFAGMMLTALVLGFFTIRNHS